jgi:putative DNA primase/helicase
MTSTGSLLDARIRSRPHNGVVEKCAQLGGSSEMPTRARSKLRVNADDLANLRESGLSNATIRENRLRTEGNALAFPYRDLNGAVNCFARTRPHDPPRGKNGKQIKYLQPKGSPLRAYFPVASLPKLRETNSPLYITEGEKKALALSQLKVGAIGLGGVWCGCKKGTAELIDDLAKIDWKGRVAYIVFDYDKKQNTRRQVRAAARRLAKALREAGAKKVLFVKLPPGPDGAKQGVDDYLVANSAASFRRLVKKAKSIQSEDGTPKLTILSGRTDTANAARLVAKYGDVSRWVGTWDKWLIWDEKRWMIDKELRIELLAKQIAAGLWSEIGAAVAKGNLDKDTIGAMASFAKISNSANGIRNMVALARSEPGVPIGIEDLDTDPWVLNVENGTLDLKTGELREHRRDDFLTKLAPVTYDPAATCPLWIEFLQTIFDANDELIGYLQRLAGYNLTGVTEEHILPFLYGIGANGKSTFAETLLKLLGSDYAMKAAPDLLMAKRGESHPTDRADLFGKRFVACIETEDGRRMAEALVKEITGGDRIRARRMREDFWEFTPTHHVWLAGNYKPTIVGTDIGIWRRIKLIPFDVVIADDEQDKQLPSKLADELPGILNWALEGCLEWQQNGMQEPDIVQVATKEYADEMDDIGQFLDEECELSPEVTAPATELFQAYLTANPGISMTQKSFGASLRRRGFEKARITKGINKAKHGWKGLRLRMGNDAISERSERFYEEMKSKRKKRNG